MTDNYSIRELVVEDLEHDEIFQFLVKTSNQMSELYGNKFNMRNFRIVDYVRHARMTMCFRNEKPVGVMMARLSSTIFDPEVKILRQDHLSAKPGTRAASLLLKDFVDFGKSNANHIITMIAPKTNIKRRSLEKLGFTELETLYRLEV